LREKRQTMRARAERSSQGRPAAIRATSPREAIDSARQCGSRRVGVAESDTR
jgi:hypothetical protein